MGCREGVSKLSFQCGSRDAKFCVSTIWLDKLLILNVLYVVVNIETRHATSLLMAKSHFDTPSTAGEGEPVFLCVIDAIGARRGAAGWNRIRGGGSGQKYFAGNFFACETVLLQLFAYFAN